MEDFGVFWRILRISRTSCAERRCILRILRIYFENFEDFDDFEDFFEDFSPPKVSKTFQNSTKLPQNNEKNQHVFTYHGAFVAAVCV